MAGNVWEGMENLYQENEVWRALRGGAWWNDADGLVCSARVSNVPDHGYALDGFRVLRAQS